LRILLVDDEPDILESVRAGLERRGFMVDAFNDPAMALSRFKEGVYEMVLLDIRMPKMNGFQLYREILLRDSQVRVKFFTAFEEYREEFRQAFPELDERRFIRKPTTLGRLADILTRELEPRPALKSR
jgi:two-component system, OmpR family, response regulator ChvI